MTMDWPSQRTPTTGTSAAESRIISLMILIPSTVDFVSHFMIGVLISIGVLLHWMFGLPAAALATPAKGIRSTSSSPRRSATCCTHVPVSRIIAYSEALTLAGSTRDSTLSNGSE